MRLLHTSDWHLGPHALPDEPARARSAAFLALAARARRRAARSTPCSSPATSTTARCPPLDAVRCSTAPSWPSPRRGIPLRRSSAATTTPPSASASAAGWPLRPASTCAPRRRTSREPVVLTDEHGEVAVYGIPYLLPDAVKDRPRRRALARVGAARGRPADPCRRRARGITRTVVARARVRHGRHRQRVRARHPGRRHRRRARRRVFDGVSLRRARPPAPPAGGRASPAARTVLRYSGSPLAFSFGEKDDTKSVTLVELDADGVAAPTTIPHARAAAAARGARPPRRPARRDAPPTTRRARRGLGQGGAHRPEPPRLADGAAARALAAHPRARLRARGRAVVQRRPTSPVCGAPPTRCEVCTLFVEYVDSAPRHRPRRSPCYRDAVEPVRDRRGGGLMRLHT